MNKSYVSVTFSGTYGFEPGFGSFLGSEKPSNGAKSSPLTGAGIF